MAADMRAPDVARQLRLALARFLEVDPQGTEIVTEVGTWHDDGDWQAKFAVHVGGQFFDVQVWPQGSKAPRSRGKGPRGLLG